MPFDEKFDRFPRRAAIVFAIAGFVLAAIASQVMSYFSTLSGNEASLFESQLSFSDTFLRNQYAAIIAAGGMNAYRIVVTVDFAFMTGYGLISAGVAILVTRIQPLNTLHRRAGHVFTIIAPVGAGLDAIENSLILAMLVDPLGFPGWLAYAHSAFALAKWIVLFVSMAWAGVATLVGLYMKRRG